MRGIPAIIALFAAFVVAAMPLHAEAGVPKGWTLQGSKPNDYVVQMESEKGLHGRSVLIEAKDDSQGNATLMQAIEADHYRGKRIRFSGYIKGNGVKSWAGLWMRVNDMNNRVTVFDNTEKRGFHGDGDWKKMDIVFDVPRESETISFGVLLSGAGKIWVSGLKFEVVGKSVPVTVKSFSHELSKTPVNMDLE
ncbi:hypothetical protein KGO95_03270 [Patescibacteria group bacterium]|nr:hypothetical protein [Patescibacteria group bacterium]